MLIVLPTHPGDRYLAVPLAAHIRNLGCARGHDLLIVCPIGTNLAGIEDVMSQAFNRVNVFAYRETLKGWPHGANEAAYHVFTQVITNNWGNYFLLLEPDCIPTCRNSFDDLEREYIRCGKNMLGVTVSTVTLDKQPTNSKHTVGVAIYPKNFAQLVPLVKSLMRSATTWASAHYANPYDAYFGAYTSQMTAQTSSIFHFNRMFVRDAQGGIHWDCPSLDNALSQVPRRPDGSIAPLLLHGCKHHLFLTQLFGGQNHATQERPRQSDDSQKRLGNDEGTNGSQSSPEVRQSEGKEDSSGGSVRSIPQVGKTKEQIREEKRLERARVKRISDLTKIKNEYLIEFDIDTIEWNRTMELLADQKTDYSDFKKYARNLGLKIQRGWKKGRLFCEIVKVEREQRKEKWTEALPPLPVDPAKIEAELVQPVTEDGIPIIIPAGAVSPTKTLLANETFVAVARPDPNAVCATGAAIAQIIPIGSRANPRMPTNGMTIDRAAKMQNLVAQRRLRGLPV